ncbi:MAG: hypothetical protein E7086_09385 [Bacteroidales bacterium]|nr:hypothetical protein [Bacteroidales bacterium]
MIKTIKTTFLITFLMLTNVGAQEIATLTVSDFEINSGGNATLTVESDIALNNYCSFQFDILLPDGVILPYNLNPDEEEEQFGYYDSDSEEWIPAIESGITKSSHTLACSAIQGGYRFVCYHPNFTVFKSGSKNVLTLHLQTDDEVINGAYRTTIGGTMFIANRDEHFIPEVTAGIAIVKGSDKSVTYEFIMSEAKWGTLMLPFDADVPAGITAYNCIEINGNKVILSESSTIYANTPYLLNGTAGTYTFTGIPSVDKNEYSSGCMNGVHSETTIYNGYVLQNIDGIVAFYKVNENNPINVPSAHCYINTISDALYIGIDRVTGIDGIIYNANESDIYDINGIKTESIDNNRIYIINNKKKFIK